MDCEGKSSRSAEGNHCGLEAASTFVLTSTWLMLRVSAQLHFAVRSPAGVVNIQLPDRKKPTSIGITRAHIEEDAGKLVGALSPSPQNAHNLDQQRRNLGTSSATSTKHSCRPRSFMNFACPIEAEPMDAGQALHDADELEPHLAQVHSGASALSGSDYSLVDYNRAGVPLLEIVTEPDLRTGAEAAEYGAEIQRIMRTIGASNGNMQEGSMRCDVNISIRPKGQEEFGTKVIFLPGRRRLLPP